MISPVMSAATFTPISTISWVNAAGARRASSLASRGFASRPVRKRMCSGLLIEREQRTGQPSLGQGCGEFRRAGRLDAAALDSAAGEKARQHRVDDADG